MLCITQRHRQQSGDSQRKRGLGGGGGGQSGGDGDRRRLCLRRWVVHLKPACFTMQCHPNKFNLKIMQNYHLIYQSLVVKTNGTYVLNTYCVTSISVYLLSSHLHSS